MEETVILLKLISLIVDTLSSFITIFRNYRNGNRKIRELISELAAVLISEERERLGLREELNAKRFVNSRLERLNDSLIQNFIPEEEIAYIDDKQDIWSDNGINDFRIQILTIKFIIFQISMSRIRAISIGAVGNFRKVTQLVLGK